MLLTKDTKELTCDVLVVGAGPAGSGAAFSAAKHGAKTIIVDKKQVIGSPVECGECIDPSLLKKFNVTIPKNIISTKQNGTVFTINKNIEITNTSKNWETITVDRNRLDKYFAYLAVNAGAQIFANSEVINAKIDKNKVITKVILNTVRGKKTIVPKIVVAADGTNSIFGKIQKRIKLKNFEIGRTVSYEMTGLKLRWPDKVQIFFDALSGYGYGYIIPKSNNSANVGLGQLGLNAYPWNALDEFLNKHPIVAPQVKNAGIIEIKTGETPISGPKLPTVIGNVLYAGDAAGQNLSHVGEGAIPSYVCGRLAGKTAAKSSKSKNISQLQDYNKELKKTILPLLLQCNAIREEVFRVFAMPHLPPGKKILLAGLLASETLPPIPEIIDSLSKKQINKIIHYVSNYIKGTPIRIQKI